MPRSMPRSWPIAAAASVSWPTTSPMTTHRRARRLQERVVPVAADLGGPHGRPVAHDDLGVVGLGRRGEQAALQPLGQPALLLVEPRVVQGEGDPVGHLAHGGDVVGVGRRPVGRSGRCSAPRPCARGPAATARPPSAGPAPRTRRGPRPAAGSGRRPPATSSTIIGWPDAQRLARSGAVEPQRAPAAAGSTAPPPRRSPGRRASSPTSCSRPSSPTRLAITQSPSTGTTAAGEPPDGLLLAARLGERVGDRPTATSAITASRAAPRRAPPRRPAAR